MNKKRTVLRRDFLKHTTVFGGAAFLSAGLKSRAGARQPGGSPGDRPNILFLNVDQMAMQAIGGYGCGYVKTPNIDRLIKRGYSFKKSYAADPVCGPARSCWQTGRMSSEHGVVRNGDDIVPDMPDMGQWFRQSGYRTYHAGKWHVFGRDVTKSYSVLCYGTADYGENGDAPVTRSVEAFLQNYKNDEPFLLLCGLMNPHDVCLWIGQHYGYGGELPYPWLKEELPPLPDNFMPEKKECEYIQSMRNYTLRVRRVNAWSDDTWRYYRWAYYRYVEMVDAYIGMVFDALEASPFADNTLLVFSSDHGDQYGAHQLTTKGVLYEEAARVPLIFHSPGRVPENVVDEEHLVSGLDLLPTLCDYAGIEPPPHQRGYSLKPLLEGHLVGKWREFVPAQCWIKGRMIRTDRYKYVMYKGDENPTEQLFDLENDPGETQNLAYDPTHQAVLSNHRKILREFEGGLNNA